MSREPVLGGRVGAFRSGRRGHEAPPFTRGTASRSSLARARRTSEHPWPLPWSAIRCRWRGCVRPAGLPTPGANGLGADHPKRHRSRRLKAGQSEAKKTAVRGTCLRGFPLVAWTHRLKGGRRWQRHAGSSIGTSKRARSGWSGETGKPIAQVAKDLGINEGTLGNWVNADLARRRRQYTSDDGSNPGSSSGAPIATYHRTSNRTASAVSWSE